MVSAAAAACRACCDVQRHRVDQVDVVAGQRERDRVRARAAADVEDRGLGARAGGAAAGPRSGPTPAGRSGRSAGPARRRTRSTRRPRAGACLDGRPVGECISGYLPIMVMPPIDPEPPTPAPDPTPPGPAPDPMPPTPTPDPMPPTPDPAAGAAQPRPHAQPRTRHRLLSPQTPARPLTPRGRAVPSTRSHRPTAAGRSPVVAGADLDAAWAVWAGSVVGGAGGQLAVGVGEAACGRRGSPPPRP